MIELVVVVGLIIVMAAVALPNIGRFVRQSRVRGGTQEVAGEIQTARNKGIVRNVSPGRRGGVVFAILDQNTYRYTVVDDTFAAGDPPNPRLGVGPMRDLPQGLIFVPGANTPVSAIGFDSLGRRCEITNDPTKPTCAWPATATMAAMCPEPPPDNRRCSDHPLGNYLDLPTVGATDIRVRVQDRITGLVRTVLVTPGGKVMAQR
jgi:hypothetical protein